jgi:hypothetical protein
VPGRQRYQRAWGFLPAAIGPPWCGVAVQLPLQREMHGRMVGSRLERWSTIFQVVERLRLPVRPLRSRGQDLALSRGGEGCIRNKNTRARGPAVPSLVCFRPDSASQSRTFIVRVRMPYLRLSSRASPRARPRTQDRNDNRRLKVRASALLQPGDKIQKSREPCRNGGSPFVLAYAIGDFEITELRYEKLSRRIPGQT